MPVKKSKKPSKPYAEIPLTTHAKGQWCKKIRWKVHFFGVRSYSDAALRKYLDERDDLQAGTQLRRLSSTSLSLADACNLYLNAQRLKADAGELRQQIWRERKEICANMLEVLCRNIPVESLQPEDFCRLRA